MKSVPFVFLTNGFVGVCKVFDTSQNDVQIMLRNVSGSVIPTKGLSVTTSC
jgi:hypothetical protein